jgi:hypothetical protein
VDPAARQLDLSPFNFIVCNSVLEYIASNLILPHEADAIRTPWHLKVIDVDYIKDEQHGEPVHSMRLM